jgi:hypothetical protein
VTFGCEPYACFYEIISNSRSIFPFRPLIREFVLEKAYKKLPVILKKLFRKPPGTFAALAEFFLLPMHDGPAGEN